MGAIDSLFAYAGLLISSARVCVVTVMGPLEIGCVEHRCSTAPHSWGRRTTFGIIGIYLKVFAEVKVVKFPWSAK